MKEAPDKAKYVPFTQISEYVEHWCATHKVQLTNVQVSMKVDKDSPNSNDCAVNGIGFKLWIGERPTNRKMLMQMCCADSRTDGYAISTAQAKTATTNWLHSESARLLSEHSGDALFIF